MAVCERPLAVGHTLPRADHPASASATWAKGTLFERALEGCQGFTSWHPEKATDTETLNFHVIYLGIYGPTYWASMGHRTDPLPVLSRTRLYPGARCHPLLDIPSAVMHCLKILAGSLSPTIPTSTTTRCPSLLVQACRHIASQPGD